MNQTSLRSEQNSGQSKNKIQQHGLFNFANLGRKNPTNPSTPHGSLLSKYWWLLIIPIIVGYTVAKLTNPPQTIKAVQGTESVQLSPPPSPTLTPIPTPIDVCKTDGFNEELWDIKTFYKQDDDGYWIQKTPSDKYPYQPITYKKEIPSIFKRLYIAYEANHRNDSTQSAVLRITLHYKNSKRMQLDLPNENNREIIGIVIPNSISSKRGGHEIPTPLAYDKGHDITISAEADGDKNIIYHFVGHYLDNISKKQQSFEAFRTAEGFTVTPSKEELTLTLATKGHGKLDLKDFSFCP